MSEQIIFSNIGNYRIINYKLPFLNIQSVRGVVIDTTNEIPDISYLHQEFRWGINDSNWSLWLDINSDNLSTIDTTYSDIYLEFRFTLISNDVNYPIGFRIENPVTIEDFSPDILYKIIDTRDFVKAPIPICSKEMYTNSIIFRECPTDKLFQPYDVNRGINVYQDLSKAVNILFGHEVNYYSVQPNGRGKDIILREYNLFDVVDEKCIKVMVPNNAFPDNKPVYDSFGVLFAAPLEVHIDRKYFESFFGKGAQPRKRDIIFFPLTNRIYQIESTYLHRDFNLYPVFFKCQLMKYDVKKNTDWDNKQAETDLLDYTVNTEDLFGKETTDEINKNTKPLQYFVSTQRRNEDPVRSYINSNLPIIEFDLNNNWSIVFNSYYDLEKYTYNNSEYSDLTKYSTEAIRYYFSPKLDANDALSFTCWYSIRNYINRTKLVNKPASILPITSFERSTGTITYSTYPVTHKISMDINQESYVSISADKKRTGGFKVLSVPDQYTFTVIDDGSQIQGSGTNWRFQKSQDRTLIYGRKDGKGIQIQIIWTGSNIDTSDYLQIGSFRILINDLEILSPFGDGIDNSFIPQIDIWYGFVFNFSNLFKQYSINTWKLTYDPDIVVPQNSDLDLVHFNEGLLSEKYTYDIPTDIESSNQSDKFQTDNNSYKLIGSPLYLTNLRFFKTMIDTEKQSAILNENIITDSQLATFIDNAKIVLKLPRLAKNR